MLQRWGTYAIFANLIMAILLTVGLIFLSGSVTSSAHFYAATFPQTALPSVVHPGDASPSQVIALSSFVTEQGQSIAVVSSFTIAMPGAPSMVKNPAALLDCMLMLDSDALASVHDSWNTPPQGQDVVLAGIDTFQKGVHALQLNCHAYNGATTAAMLILTSLGTTITVD